MRIVVVLLCCCWWSGCIRPGAIHGSPPTWAERHGCYVITPPNGPDHWNRPGCAKMMGF